MRINVEDEDLTGSHLYDILTNARKDCQTLKDYQKVLFKVFEKPVIKYNFYIFAEYLRLSEDLILLQYYNDFINYVNNLSTNQNIILKKKFNIN